MTVYKIKNTKNEMYLKVIEGLISWVDNPKEASCVSPSKETTLEETKKLLEDMLADDETCTINDLELIEIH